MKSDLRLAFEAVRGSIFHEPSRPARINQGNQLLIDIMRETTGGKSEFNAEALQKHGIDPKEFLKAWAFVYAKITLGYHDNQTPYRDVLVNRCLNCLETKEETSFGHYLSDGIKADVRAKLAVNGGAPSLDA